MTEEEITWADRVSISLYLSVSFIKQQVAKLKYYTT